MVELIPNPEFDRVAGTALASFRDAIPGAFVPPMIEELQARARRRAVVRGTSVAFATVLCVVLVVAGVMVAARPHGLAPPPDPGVRPSVNPPPTSPSPSASPSPLASTGGSTENPWPPAWRGVTLQMPPPSPRYSACPAGRVTIAGLADTFLAGKQIWLGPILATGDLTGDGRTEAVAYMHCSQENDGGDSSGHLVVITRTTGGGFVGLAHVGPDGEEYPAATIQHGDLVATIDQRYGADVHQRTYRWNGTSFVQVAGPTAFR
jgi:hypothetical protein